MFFIIHLYTNKYTDGLSVLGHAQRVGSGRILEAVHGTFGEEFFLVEEFVGGRQLIGLPDELPDDNGSVFVCGKLEGAVRSDLVERDFTDEGETGVYPSIREHDLAFQITFLPIARNSVEESPEALFVGHPVLRDADGEGGSVHPAHLTLTTDGLAGGETTRATIAAGPDVATNTAVAAGIGLAAVASITDVTAVAAAGVATVVVATGAAIAAHGGRARGFGGVTSTSQVGEQDHAPQKEGDGQHTLLHHRLPPRQCRLRRRLSRIR